MAAIVTQVLQMLALIGAATREGSTIAMVIRALTDLLPTVVQEAKDVAPAVKNIITALKSNPAADAGQLQALAELDAKVDAEFDQAAAAAEAEDATYESPSIVPTSDAGSN